MLVVMLSATIVSAATQISPPSGVTNYTIFTFNGNTIYAIAPDGDSKFYVNVQGDIVCNGTWRMFTWNGSSWNSGSQMQQIQGVAPKSMVTNVYGTASIYNDSALSTYFFSAPHPPKPLKEILQGVQLGIVLKQIVGLLPLLISLIVGFLGLRKGLNLLSTVLHQA